VTLLGRDVAEVEALVTDRYLDSLLAVPDLMPGASAAMGWRAALGPLASVGHGRPAGGGDGDRPGDRASGARLDRGVRLASERLTRDLPRFHPSFRFEERLAVRLAEAAAAMRLPAAAGAEGSVRIVPFPAPELPPGFDPFTDVPEEDDDPAAISRPLLIGGAMAASALSLAGAAWVAWRRSRTSGSPMARAARAAHAMRGRPA
jgi:hypothetical protein